MSVEEKNTRNIVQRKRYHQDPGFMLVLSNRIAKSLDKQLSIDDVTRITTIVSKAKPKHKSKNIKEALVSYSLMIETLFKAGKDETIDIHELLKEELGKAGDDTSYAVIDQEETQASKSVIVNAIETEVNSILRLNTDRAIQLMFNPTARYKTRYLFLDTKYQDDELNGTGKFKWDLSAGSTPSQGTVVMNGPIKNIVGIRLGPSRWAEIDVLNYTESTYPLARWTILIEELSAQ